MSMDITLDTDGPRDPRYVLEVAEAFAEAVRVLNHLTLSHEALQYPAELDTLIRSVASGVARLPQLLSQIERWLAVEYAAGRLRVPDGKYAGHPGAAAIAAGLGLETARADAEILQGALDSVASVTADLAAAETDAR